MRHPKDAIFLSMQNCGLVLTRAIDGRPGALFETEPGGGHVFSLECVTKPSLEIACENPGYQLAEKPLICLTYVRLAAVGYICSISQIFIKLQ